jgi:hypothetical protein
MTFLSLALKSIPLLANKSNAENPLEPTFVENPENKGIPINQLYFTSEPGLINMD